REPAPAIAHRALRRGRLARARSRRDGRPRLRWPPEPEEPAPRRRRGHPPASEGPPPAESRNPPGHRRHHRGVQLLMTVWPEERIATMDAFDTVDMTINVGPQHPATHGVFRMVLTVDGELVVDCEPYIGYLHRGLEKLTENHDYRQSMG